MLADLRAEIAQTVLAARTTKTWISCPRWELDTRLWVRKNGLDISRYNEMVKEGTSLLIANDPLVSEWPSIPEQPVLAVRPTITFRKRETKPSSQASDQNKAAEQPLARGQPLTPGQPVLAVQPTITFKPRETKPSLPATDQTKVADKPLLAIQPIPTFRPRGKDLSSPAADQTAATTAPTGSTQVRPRYMAPEHQPPVSDSELADAMEQYILMRTAPGMLPLIDNPPSTGDPKTIEILESMQWTRWWPYSGPNQLTDSDSNQKLILNKLGTSIAVARCLDPKVYGGTMEYNLGFCADYVNKGECEFSSWETCPLRHRMPDGIERNWMKKAFVKNGMKHLSKLPFPPDATVARYSGRPRRYWDLTWYEPRPSVDAQPGQTDWQDTSQWIHTSRPADLQQADNAQRAAGGEPADAQEPYTAAAGAARSSSPVRWFCDDSEEEGGVSIA